MYGEVGAQKAEVSDPKFMTTGTCTPKKGEEVLKPKMCLRGSEINIDLDIRLAYEHVGFAVGCTPSVVVQRHLREQRHILVLHRKPTWYSTM